MTFTDEEKEILAVQLIIDYKNKDFTHDEIKTKHGLAVKYIVENFDTLFSNVSFGGSITSFKEGDRSVDYNVNGSNIISNNVFLKSLLGRPFLKVY